MPSHTARAKIPDEDYLLRLALCLGILLAVRLAAVHASTTDLGPDEAQYWSWSLTRIRIFFEAAADRLGDKRRFNRDLR